MANTVVDDGQVSTGAVLNAGDTQSVQSSTQNITTGGKAYLTTININGQQTVTYGTTDHVIVNGGKNGSSNRHSAFVKSVGKPARFAHAARE